MRRFQGKTGLSFVAMLMLAAVISPMADATQPTTSPGAKDITVLSPHLRMDRIAMLDGNAKASRISTDPAGPVDARVAVAQIPADLVGTVYYDTRKVASEATQATASLLSTATAPGKWTSVLATILLCAFLFWRRAS